MDKGEVSMKKRSAVLNWSLRVGVLSLALMLPLQAMAGSYEVFVGYADNLRATPFFPTPFFEDPSVALYVGQDPSLSQLDAGAVMVLNNGGTNITLNGLTVSVPGNGWTDPSWNSSIPALGQVLTPGQSAIFTQTAQFNFDTSDPGYVSKNLFDNCSVGPTAATPVCINNAPFVDPTVNGVLSVLRDTGHVLDTGGFDANCCLLNGNESLQWRLIGTTGVQDPGGNGVPEPASVLLLGSGLVGLAAWLRKQQRLNKTA